MAASAAGRAGGMSASPRSPHAGSAAAAQPSRAEPSRQPPPAPQKVKSAGARAASRPFDRLRAARPSAGPLFVSRLESSRAVRAGLAGCQTEHGGPPPAGSATALRYSPPDPSPPLPQPPDDRRTPQTGPRHVCRAGHRPRHDASRCVMSTRC